MLAAPGSVRAQEPEFFPVDELREGMTGVGRTVFHGTAIEEFDVEILGVLRNAAPRQDMVLARLSGGPLAETGVLQGMSGSPVYIDGRLLGAVAFAFDGSTEPIAGIQPIAQMVGVLDQPSAPPSLAVLPNESVPGYVNRVMTAMGAAGSFESQLLGGFWPGEGLAPLAAAVRGPGWRPIQTPLFLSGISPATIRRFADVFAAYGLTPVQGGGAGSAASVAGDGAAGIAPGSSINAELARGDISISANGTVTYVDGDKVYAFGHPFQSAGPTNLPMSRGYVLSLVPTRGTSFKIAVPLDAVGSFHQDRSTGILGRLGENAAMIPVRVDVQTSRNGVERYEYEVIDDRFMTPLMMNLTLFELILATERSLGESTLEVEGSVLLASGESIPLNAAFSGDLNASAQATLATVAPITYLLSTGAREFAIESIDLRVRSTDSRRNARLDAVRVDRTEIRAGETVTLEAVLRTPDGGRFVEQFPVSIPAGLAPGRIQLLVGDGVSVTTSDLRRAPAAPPRSVDQVLRELNGLRKMDRLYVKVLSSAPGVVIGGEELPSLPPSMLAMMSTARSAEGSATGIRSSAVSEFELNPSSYVIQGQQTLTLTIVP